MGFTVSDSTSATFLVVVAALVLIAFTGCNAESDESTAQRNAASGPATPNMTRSPEPITGPVLYVALGDSTGVGVGAREGGYVARLFRKIVAQRPESKLTNLCVSGATTSDVLRSQLDRGVNANANLITLGIGINDIGNGFSIEQFSRNYEAILSRLRSDTKATIVVTNLPDISSAPRIPLLMRDGYRAQIVEFNSRLEEVARRHNVTIFDVYSITHAELASHPEYFSGDGFHPSDAGYQLWAEQMWPTLAQAIGLDHRQ
jgi:acyl-CoA thioesterase-1